jgi:protein-S-isoprenylcysteine O-methyltransferase Ste14
VVVFRTNREEENLIARFGDDYRRYMERTGRFFPRPAPFGNRGAGSLGTAD